MRYFFIVGTTVAILLLTACGPAATPETVPTPPPATPTTDSAQTTSDSTLPPEATPLPPTPTTDSARTTSDSTQPTEATPLPSTAETPIPVASEETGEGRATIGDAVIIYQRSGGFAGVHEQWTIYPDGRITANDGREWQVAAERVEQLLADIEALGFFEMTGRYMPLNTCCDRFIYEITVRSGDRVNTVKTIDAAPDTPAELWRVIDEVSRLVSGLGEG
jgi:hypothetical protein